MIKTILLCQVCLPDVLILLSIQMSSKKKNTTTNNNQIHFKLKKPIFISLQKIASQQKINQAEIRLKFGRNLPGIHKYQTNFRSLKKPRSFFHPQNTQHSPELAQPT
jgi:hypothetical protein